MNPESLCPRKFKGDPQKMRDKVAQALPLHPVVRCGPSVSGAAPPQGAMACTGEGNSGWARDLHAAVTRPPNSEQKPQ